jgi:hypothetical protein
VNKKGSLVSCCKPFVHPDSRRSKQQYARKNPGHQDWPGKRIDLRDELALFLSKVLTGWVKKDLIVFVAFEETAPDEQAKKRGGEDSAGDQ